MAQPYVSGNSIIIYVNDIAVACQTNADIQHSSDSAEATCKGSYANRVVVATTKSTTITFDALMTYDANSYILLWDAWNLQQDVVVRWGGQNSGEFQFYGTAVISQLELSAQSNELATWTGTLDISGAVTKITNS